MKNLFLTLAFVCAVGSAAPEIPAPNQDVVLIDITGRWSSNCFKDFSGIFIEEIYEFRPNDSFRREQKRYNTTGCGFDSLEESRVYEGTYTMEGTAQTIGPDVKKINLEIEHVLTTVFNEDMLSKFNTSSLCTISDWRRAEQRDVTGLLCKGVVIPVGSVLYDLVQRRNEVLYFGENSYFRDQSQRKNRATKLDYDVPYTKTGSLAE